MCIQDVSELEYHKERARTEESIQGFGCIRRYGWYQEIPQKEHYLREQMRAIQASLGEDERDNEELEQIKKKISALPLPKESVEKLEKEYSMPSESCM